jgi:hypothetical protein
MEGAVENRVMAVVANHVSHGDEVCFVVVAESADRMGWPILHTLGSQAASDYRPVRAIDLGPAPGRHVGVVEVFGPARSLPVSREL